MQVLGAVLADASGQTIARIAHLLDPEDFYRASHQAVWRVALDLYRAGRQADLVMVAEAMRAAGDLDAAGGMPYLMELVDAAVPGARLEEYAELIRDRATLRDLAAAGRDIARAASGTDGMPAAALVDLAMARIGAVADRRYDHGVMRVRDLVMPTLEAIEAGERGLATGFPDLDRMTQGMQPGDLWLLAARPSMGKTSLAVQMLAHVTIRERRPAVFFSLEMSSVQVVTRMLSIVARIDARRAVRQMDPEASRKLAWAASEIAEAPLWIDDSGTLGVTEMRALARRIEMQAGERLGLIAVDYLQLMRGEAQNEGRVQEVSSISRGLKQAAKEFGCPVLALSQLSRAPESRTDARPRLSDLRDSGSLEQDADVVLFLYRPEYYERPKPGEPPDHSAELIVAKQRNGPTGTVELYFHPEHTRFDSVERQRDAA